jgi:hypothetical protein
MLRLLAFLMLACVPQMHATEALPPFASFIGQSIESDEVQRFVVSRGDDFRSLDDDRLYDGHDLGICLP